MPETDVRAFRVVSENEHSGYALNFPHFEYEVVELPIREGRVASQNDAYFAYGCYAFFFLDPFYWDRWRNMSLLLYRPGYETVEIPERSLVNFIGWIQSERVVWKEAPTLEAQVEALKKVVTHPLFGGQGQIGIRTCDQKALEFAAKEYARLAESPLAVSAEKADIRTRLLAEAEKYKAKLKELDGAASQDIKQVTVQETGNTGETR